ncbi:hypothetical protein Fmac_003501 [Flemingia macrophylla]|uniref:Uncharacterized protein n=1 Tax=Flemingia macrophylla TaxID=520843 RepID=A0ABD1NNK4_9FABA
MDLQQNSKSHAAKFGVAEQLLAPQRRRCCALNYTDHNFSNFAAIPDRMIDNR